MPKQMKLKFPVQADTKLKKALFVQIAYETIRLKHNEVGKKYKDGLINKEEWDKWVFDYFDPRHDAIVEMILKFRALMRKDKTFTIDLDKSFEEVV